MTTLIDVHLPHMGVVEQAVLTSWLRSPGDRVEADEPLCEVSTDKVDTEVVSPVSGVLVGYVAQINDEVPVGAVIARFAPPEATDDEIAEAIRGGSAPAPAATPAPAPAPAQEPEPVAPVRPEPSVNGHAPGATEAKPAPLAVAEPPEDASLVLRAGWLPLPAFAAPAAGRGKPATPLVRKLAKERGLDLARIDGTGPGGRVTRKDIEAATAAPETAPQPATPAPQPARPAAARSGGVELPRGYEEVAHEAVPLTPQRRAIARNLLESVSTAPQLTAQVDVDMSAVTRVRAQVNERRLARGEAKLSFLPFIARALCATVAEHPDLNATFTEDHLLRWRPVNLGVAIDAPQGLLVPVIRDAERLTAPALGDAMADLTRLVRDRKVSAADLTGGTITISNSGSAGGVTATPILTQPQVASLGIPAIVRTPVAVTSPEGEEYVAIRPVARFGLTFDHRAFDGVAALRALQAIQHKLETWSAEAYL
ncbi:dihydrolipoamide acetyltransferase family protein [Amycolatopsis thermoflava]|uniref:dihydrolipoamide acetyltransferase family protein n=1 Tax=Amycolatopsis thermoflava TaxID=84480 RepID=UPI00040DE27E|nr:dihydrolipoamide acetyltransferase family protein [Amycolatopsis thermoflava]